MCGIYTVIISSDDWRRERNNINSSMHDEHQQFCMFEQSLKQKVEARGPDASNTHILDIGGNHVALFNSLLSLRGHCVDCPPLHDDRGNFLCYNGQIWLGLADVEQSLDSNDTKSLFETFNACSGNEQFLNIVQNLRGPWAFVYFNARAGRLWFGRDPLGRRSLMFKLKCDTSGSKVSRLEIASVSGSPQSDWNELESRSLYYLDFLQGSITLPQQIPWLFKHLSLGNDLHLEIPFSLPVDTVFKTSEGGCRDERLYDACRQQLRSVLYESIRIRIESIPGIYEHCEQPKFAVLFSGGVDCALIARLSSDIAPPGLPIELINFAFANPRYKTTPEIASEQLFGSCPDRIRAIDTLLDLERACPNREFRLICVDVEYEELQKNWNLILSLMYPNDTEMDLSISSALFFASKADGYLWKDSHKKKNAYHSKVKVLFSGLGADEQFGGYKRHLSAMKLGGWESFRLEITKDIMRLPTRNLGRDDRIISIHGREVRYPFLDERVISLASSLPLDTKMELSAQYGDKIILRELAHSLDIPSAGMACKQAIQFGARSAKLSSKSGQTKISPIKQFN